MSSCPAKLQPMTTIIDDAMWSRILVGAEIARNSALKVMYRAQSCRYGDDCWTMLFSNTCRMHMWSFNWSTAIPTTIIRLKYRIFRTFYSGSLHAVNFEVDPLIVSPMCASCPSHHFILLHHIVIGNSRYASRPNIHACPDSPEIPQSRSCTSVNNHFIRILICTSCSSGSWRWQCTFSRQS
jgi:hypothetical protein